MSDDMMYAEDDLDFIATGPTPDELTAIESAKREERRRTLKGIRDIAQFLEDRPDLPLPICPSFIAHVPDAADFAAKARLMGDAEKTPSGEFYGITKRFGPVTYEIYIHREKVCAKRVIGTRTVPEHTEDLVEWECTDSILRTHTNDNEQPQTPVGGEAS